MDIVLVLFEKLFQFLSDLPQLILHNSLHPGGYVGACAGLTSCCMLTWLLVHSLAQLLFQRFHRLLAWLLLRLLLWLLLRLPFRLHWRLLRRLLSGLALVLGTSLDQGCLELVFVVLLRAIALYTRSLLCACGLFLVTASCSAANRAGAPSLDLLQCSSSLFAAVSCPYDIFTNCAPEETTLCPGITGESSDWAASSASCSLFSSACTWTLDCQVPEALLSFTPALPYSDFEYLGMSHLVVFPAYTFPAHTPTCALLTFHDTPPDYALTSWCSRRIPPRLKPANG